MQTVLVTGAAGFIGSHLSKELLEQGYNVVGLDSVIPYYDLRVKENHLAEIQKHPHASERFTMYRSDINDRENTERILQDHKPEIIVHLAAQAGVRYCEANPDEAKRNNIGATELLLELIQNPGCSVKQFLFASSSSIYGEHPRPWREELEPRPVGIYGTSKFKGEVMCRELAEKQTGISIAAMRFFTVYGPLGRPDMAPAKFLDLIYRRNPIPVYGDGSAIRDFTHVFDIVSGIVSTIKNPPAQFELYNLGKGTLTPYSVLDLIQMLEKHSRKKAFIDFQEPQKGDVPATQADITKAQTQLGYNPRFELDEGLEQTVSYFLRNVTKFVIVLLQSTNKEQFAKAIKALESQTKPADLIIVLDECSETDYQENDSLLNSIKTQNKPEHLQVDNFSSGLSTGIERICSHFTNRSFDCFDERSNVFVNFMKDSQCVSENYIQDLVEDVSSLGFEAIVESLERNLIRFDVFEEASNQNSNTTGDEHISSVMETLRSQDVFYTKN